MLAWHLLAMLRGRNSDRRPERGCRLADQTWDALQTLQKSKRFKTGRCFFLAGNRIHCKINVISALLAKAMSLRSRGRPKERSFGLSAEIDEHRATEMVRFFGLFLPKEVFWPNDVLSAERVSFG